MEIDHYTKEQVNSLNQLWDKALELNNSITLVCSHKLHIHFYLSCLFTGI
jgi:hypothetical protein